MNGILIPFRTIERTHLLSDNFPIVPQSGPIVLPLEFPDSVRLAVERVGFHNFVEEEALLEEGMVCSYCSSS